MAGPQTIRTLLDHADASRPAISAPGRPPMTYGRLREHVDQTVGSLNLRGIGREDRVAIVLPNGPEMASAFLSIASAATTAPLNPQYRKPEFDFYLRDLGARALVVMEGSDSPAIESAEELGINLLRLGVPEGAPAGSFELSGGPVALRRSGPP